MAAAKVGLSQGGCSVKSPTRVSSTFSRPQKEHQKEANLFQVLSYSVYLSWPLCITHFWPISSYSNLTSQFAWRLSWGFHLRSMAPLLPKVLYFPAIVPSPPPHTEFRGWAQSDSRQVQDESPWPEVRAGQAQHSKLEDCVSFKHQIKVWQNPRKILRSNSHRLPCPPSVWVPSPPRVSFNTC